MASDISRTNTAYGRDVNEAEATTLEAEARTLEAEVRTLEAKTEAKAEFVQFWPSVL